MTQEEREEIQARLANHFIGLHLCGIKLPQSGYDLLVKKNLITARNKSIYVGISDNSIHSNYINRISLGHEGVEKIEEVDVEEFKPISQMTKEDKKHDPKKLLKQLEIVLPRELRNDIRKEEWFIPDKTELSDEFFNWIESIREGWQNRIRYEPFELYKEQAAAWIINSENFPHNESEDIQLEYVIEERRKMLENSVYAVNKYGVIKDDMHMLGQQIIECWEVQAFLLYLLDCELSPLIGKPRQIGSTTVITLAQIIKTMIRRNYYCKLVAQKGSKSEEIFTHKVKFPLENFSHFIKPTISNYNGQQIVFKYQESKGASSSSTSIFEVCPPSADVVNAGTPSCTLLDEVGLNDLLQEIIDNGRPTMFWHNPVTNKLEMRRQMFGWGTADASSPTFEYVYKAAKDQWLKKNFRYGIIPIFINSFAKPGFDQDFYDSEKAYYYSKKKLAGQIDPKIMFHQTFPLVEDDLWLVSDDTVVPTVYIKKQQEKLEKIPLKERPIRGYFEPVYNTLIKRDDPLIPYRIIGASFKPATQEDIDEDNLFASVYILKQPDRQWVNRYYEGVDPIFSSSGHSKMAASVWDASLKEFSGWYNGRTADYRFCYLQAMLLGLHYSNNDNDRMSGIKQLIEINVGGEYKNFVEDHKYGGTLVMNSMLPDQFQTSSVDIGVRKQGNNSKNLVTKLEELINNFGDNIKQEEFWAQCRTFVKKQTTTGIKFEPKDKRLHFDDLIDANVYAVLNAESHKHLRIYNKNEKSANNRKGRRVYGYDNNFNLVVKNAA